MTKTNLALNTILVASPDQVSADLSTDTSGSVIILGLKDGIYYELSNVGVRIWSLLQQPRSFENIINMILEEYNVDAERCEKDLSVLIQELIKYELVLVDKLSG